jgi:hypothetical protein
MFSEAVNGKFPGIPAPFPAYGVKSADFGQNLQNSGLRPKKFAAKFAAAGNCTDGFQTKKSTFGSCERGPEDGFDLFSPGALGLFGIRE